MTQLLIATKFTSKVTCALFTGAAFYINIAEHPARLECGTRIAATQFAPSYRRAAVSQVILASTSGISALVAFHLTMDKPWLVASALITSVIPYTFICIMPTNKILLDPNVDKDSPQILSLLKKWGRLHAVRTVMSLASLFIMFYLD